MPPRGVVGRICAPAAWGEASTFAGGAAANRGINNDLQASPNTALRARRECSALVLRKNGKLQARVLTDASAVLLRRSNGFVSQ
jgi:hypothetical protein